jgi:YVTN family beta-propeller protein
VKRNTIEDVAAPAAVSPMTDEPAGRLLVVCKDDQLLEVIDLPTGETVGRVTASGVTPHEVAATPDGRRAYLPVYSDAWLGDPGTDGRAIDVVDLVDLRLAETISIGFASRPHLPHVSRDGLLFVGTELDESISVFDPLSHARVARLPTGRPQSHMFAVSPDGARAYSANVDSGSVSVIDVATESLLGVIEVAAEINRISLSPDGATAFCADQREPRLAVIDVATTRVTWIDLPSRGFGTAVAPDGRRIVVALRGASQVGIIDLTVPAHLTVVDVPAHPQAIVIHPSGTHAYSACDAADEVVEVDLAAGRVTRTFPTGRQPDGLCWAVSPPG